MDSGKVEKSRIRGRWGGQMSLMSHFCRYHLGNLGSSLHSSGLSFPTCIVRKKIRHCLYSLKGLEESRGEAKVSVSLQPAQYPTTCP